MNYKQIEQAIKENKPFEHNGTMTGRIRLVRWTDYNNDTQEVFNTYEVYSYSTLMFMENLENGEQWYNTKKYSRTTSRQQSIIKRAKGIV